MDILRRCLSVELSRTGCSAGSPAFVLSQEPLSFRLTITFSNEQGDHSRDGTALLAAFGESDFTVMWRKLFHTLSISPVIVSLDKEGEEAAGVSFSFGPPPFWGGCPAADGAVECSPAGKVFSVPLAAVAATPAPGSDTAGTALPACVQSTFDFSCTVPDLDAQDGPITIGYVLLLTFPSSAVNENQSGDDVVMRKSAHSAERGTMTWHRPLYVALGTCYYRTRIVQALKCTSVSRPTSNFRVVVNINVLNLAKQPVCIKWVSFDIFSTWVGDTLGSLSSVPLWAEQHAGPRGMELHTVSIMRDAVSITPMMVHESRVPLTLQPAESVGFLYAIQVQPHLRYLLQSHSLRDVYSPFVKNASSLDMVTKTGRNLFSETTKPKAVSPQIKTAGLTNLASDAATAPAAMRREELIQALSSNFTSHVYVHYEVLSPGTTKDSVQRKEGGHLAGPQIRHAVHWSLRS